MELSIVRKEEKTGFVFKKTTYCSKVTLTIARDERRVIDGKRLNNVIFAKTQSADGAEIEVTFIDVLGVQTFKFHNSDLREKFQDQIVANKDKLQEQVYDMLVAELNETIKNSSHIPHQPASVSPEIAAKAKFLYSELKTIVEAGDHQAAYDYVIKNLKEFPDDALNKIVFAALEKGKTAAGEQQACPMSESKLPQYALELLIPYLRND